MTAAQLTNRKQDKSARIHIFESVCHEKDIEHRLTKINYPWTNGLGGAHEPHHQRGHIKRYNYSAQAQFRVHLQAFLNASNFAKRLKTLKELTPYEEIIIMVAKRTTPVYHLTYFTTGWDQTNK